MLTDYSPGFADTWDVLDRRLQDVMTIGRVMGQVGPVCGNPDCVCRNHTLVNLIYAAAKSYLLYHLKWIVADGADGQFCSFNCGAN